MMMLYKNTKIMVLSPHGNTHFFSIVGGALQGNTFAVFLSIIFLDHMLEMSIDLKKENIFTLKMPEASREIYYRSKLSR